MTSTLMAPHTQDGDRADERVWRTELSPVSFLRRAAEVHADAPALVHGARRYSYRELHDRVARLDGEEDALVAAFRAERAGEYAEVVSRTPAFLQGLAAERDRGRLTYAEVEESETDLARLRSWLSKIEARDYFGAPGRSQARSAVDGCAKALADFAAAALAVEAPAAEPAPAPASERRLRGVGE